MAEVSRCSDVVKTYGDVVAVDDVSLTVEDGEFVALVGPSGCGKTTTLNLVAGLIEITDGEIYIGDRLVNDLDPKDRDIAMVFQNYALYPNKTRLQEPRLPAEDAQAAARPRSTRKVRGRGQGARHRAPARAPAARALRRPAAARGARPGAGARPAGLPDGRAALQPRRQAARADALRAQALPPGPQRHRHLRHPRPARSGDHGRQDGGDERRRAAAVRHAGRGLRPPGQHVRRRLRRQPGDEPACRCEVAGRTASRCAAPTAGRCRCRRPTPAGPRRQRPARSSSARATAPSRLTASRAPDAVAGPGLHRRADRRHHLRPRLPRQRGRSSSASTRRVRARARRAGLDRVRPGAAAPLRRRDERRRAVAARRRA